MPINPQIPLMAQGIDAQQILLGGLKGAQSIQAMQQAAAEAPLRQQALEQAIQAKQYEADLLKAGVTASKLKPLIANKDYEGFTKALQSAGLSQEDKDMLDTYARANRWDALGTVADQYIQTARDAGVFTKDATGGAYVSDLQRFMSATPEEQAQMLKFKRSGDIKEIAGVPHVKDEMTGKWTPLTTTAAINQQEAAKAGASKLGSATGQDIADLESQWSTFSARKDALASVYKDEDLSNLLKQAPGSTLAEAFYKGGSKIIGPMSETDALGLIGQYGQALISSVPFAPGSQSDKEMQARERRAAIDSIMSSSISVNAKLKAITNFMKTEEITSRRGFEEAQKKKKEYGIAPPTEIPPPPVGQTSPVDLNAPVGGTIQPGSFRVRRVK